MVLLRLLAVLEIAIFRPCVAIANFAVPVATRVLPYLIAMDGSTALGFSETSITAVMDFAGSVIDALSLAISTEPFFNALFVCDTKVSPLMPSSVSVSTFPFFAAKFGTDKFICCASFSARFTKMTVSESPLFVMEL